MCGCPWMSFRVSQISEISTNVKGNYVLELCKPNRNIIRGKCKWQCQGQMSEMTSKIVRRLCHCTLLSGLGILDPNGTYNGPCYVRYPRQLLGQIFGNLPGRKIVCKYHFPFVKGFTHCMWRGDFSLNYYMAGMWNGVFNEFNTSVTIQTTRGRIIFWIWNRRYSCILTPSTNVPSRCSLSILYGWFLHARPLFVLSANAKRSDFLGWCSCLEKSWWTAVAGCCCPFFANTRSEYWNARTCPKYQTSVQKWPG